MVKYKQTFKRLKIKEGSTFKGWIDRRDLKRTKVRKDGVAFIPERFWTVYDKPWYDGKCVQVEVKMLRKVE